MALRLDHLFILTDVVAATVESLCDIGLIEGAANTHPGQGTANRRFFCANTMLELLYLRDIAEAENGPGEALRFAHRLADDQASPFGLIFRREAGDTATPFPGWHYYPDYLPDDLYFLVGANSDKLMEPLCICMPDDLRPPADAAPPENPGWRLTGLQIAVPVSDLSETLQQVTESPDVSLNPAQPHLLALDFNHRKQGLTHDFRPDLRLIIRR